MTRVQRIRRQAEDAIRSLGREPTPDAVADYLAAALVALSPGVSLAFLQLMPKPGTYAREPKPEPPELP